MIVTKALLVKNVSFKRISAAVAHINQSDPIFWGKKVFLRKGDILVLGEALPKWESAGEREDNDRSPSNLLNINVIRMLYSVLVFVLIQKRSGKD